MTPQIEARPTVTPLAPARVGWQFTTGQETQDLFREVQDLLGHDVPPGDVEAVLKYSLLAAKEKLLKRKCAATECPRPGGQRSADSRHVAAEVRRAVWQRDGGRCAFTSDTGHRCAERKGLEFDHVDPYARDGGATIGNVRLLCRAHNQLEAERTFGAELMRHKREEAMRERWSGMRGGGPPTSGVFASEERGPCHASRPSSSTSAASSSPPPGTARC